jgi:predicted Co/Zn/Cd cation transporter (cation efflux family)
VGEADAIRREIAEAIGGEGPHRWITIDFTADSRWL